MARLSPPMHGVLAASLVALSPALAYAQFEVEPAETLRRGAELRRDARYEEALAYLTQAIAQDRSGRALAELGLTERALSRWLEAEEHLAEALTLVEDPWVRHHRRELESALSEARASIAAVRVTSNVDGAEVRVNGAVVGRTPLTDPVRVAVGVVRIELRAEGHANATREVTVRAFDEAEAHVSLERNAPAVSEAPPPPTCPPGLTLRNGLCFAPAEAPRTGLTLPRVVMIVGGGVALVAGSVALGLWVGGNDEAAAYAGRCGGRSVPVSCEAQWRDTQASLDDRAAAVNAMWALATVGLATTAVGLVLELRPWRRRTYTDGTRFSLSPLGARLTW